MYFHDQTDLVIINGILHLEVLDHSFTGEEFADFIHGVLDQMQPWPLPNSVLVMDNASIHKVPGIREMVEERYITVVPVRILILIYCSFQGNASSVSPILLS